MKRIIRDYKTVHFLGKSAKKSKITRKKRFFLVSLMLFVVVSLFITFLFLYSPFNFTIKKSAHYVLILDNADNLSDADTIKKNVELLGGAGYIINDGGFLISAFVYVKKSDANKVQQRVTGDFPNARVLVCSAKTLRIKRFGNRNYEKILQNAANYPISLINELISTVLKLDAFKLTESEAMQQLLLLYIKADEHRSRISELCDKLADNQCAKVTRDFYLQLCNDLSAITQISGDNTNYTQKCKSLCCKLTFSYYTYRQKL